MVLGECLTLELGRPKLCLKIDQGALDLYVNDLVREGDDKVRGAQVARRDGDLQRDAYAGWRC